ncbi:membrane protein [Equine parapoxvirus]|nr:membrane protein [Equine parapoxvirus]
MRLTTPQPDAALAESDSLYDAFLGRLLRAMAAEAASAPPASAACAVHIARVRGRLRNCELAVVNRCRADAAGALALASGALAETLAALPPADRRAVAQELGVDPERPRLAPDPACAASASLEQGIDLQTLDLGDCGAPGARRLRVLLLNTGSAGANCALARVAAALSRRRAAPPPRLANAAPPRASALLALAAAAVAAAVAVALLRRRLRLRFRARLAAPRPRV